MAYKSSSTGPFTIPTAPSAGVSIVGGVANTYTATYVQMIASTAAALYITGVQVSGVVVTPTYVNVQIATGAAASEVVVGQIQLAPGGEGTKFAAQIPIWPWIPVAISTRIAAKVATDVASLTVLVTLQCMTQSLVVADTTIADPADVRTWLGTAVTAATAGIPDCNTKNINDVAAATPGAAGGVFIAGTNAATTITTGLTTTFTGNVTGSVGSVTGATGSVTAAVTLPSIPANWVTAAGINAAAMNGKGDWNIGKTGYALTAGEHTALVNETWDETTAEARTAGTYGQLFKDNVNATISSRSTYAGTAVASVTGAVGSVAAGGITAASFGASAIDAASLATDAVNEIADGLLDRAAGIETGLTPRQALRLNSAALAGVLSGAATTEILIRNAVANAKTRITATVDADGNRTAVVTDVT